jgi:uncharacterized protein YgiM (DUF1202 family)
MYRKQISSRLVGLSLIAILILTACNAAATPVAQPTQTASAVPIVPSATPIVATATPTVTPTLAETATPSTTTAPTANSSSPAPQSTAPGSTSGAQVIPTLNAYCRKGPGTGYIATTFLLTGNPYNVTGRDGLKSWWQVQAPGNVNCWVGDANVTKQGAVDQVAIVQAPPLPGGLTTFVNTYICDTTLKTLGVAFNWDAASNVTGYNLYRNGDLLTQVAADATAYHDEAPVGVDLVYELEAYNNYGVSSRLSTNVPACQ